MNVQGPDGAVIGFPDDTPPETVKDVMRKRYARHTTLGSQPGLRTVNELGKAFYGGAKEMVTSLPDTLKAIASHLSPEAPARDARALYAAAQHPLTTAGQVAGAVAPMPETLRYLLGAIAGGAMGSPPLTSAPPATTVAREAGQLVASEVLGRAPGLVKRGIRTGVRSLPGASVALHEAAIPEVEAVARTGRPPKELVEQAFAAASGADVPAIWMGNLRRTARKLLQREMQLSPGSRDAQIVSRLRNVLDDSSAGWRPEQLKAELDRMGARLGGVAGVEGLSRVQDKHLRALMRALYKDIDEGLVARERRPARPPDRVWVPQSGQWVDVPGVPAKYGPVRPKRAIGGVAAGRGAQTIEMESVQRPGQPAQPAGPAAATAATKEWSRAWTEAQRLARRAHGFDELESLVNRPGVISVVGDQYKSLNINGVLRNIDRQLRLAQQVSGPGVKRAKRFVGSFNPGELETIRAKFDEIAGDLPRIPVGRGAAHGSGGKIVRTIISTLLGEHIGEAVGHPAIGLAVGVALPDLIAMATTTPSGRAAIKFASKIDPTVGPVFQHTLAGLLRAKPQASAELMPSPSPTPLPVPGPTTSDPNKLLYSIIQSGLMPAPSGAQ